MTAVFAHGRLRLYLLHLLGDGPKHGYELIRLLRERFGGHYVPSTGTVYPRLQRMAADGQVRHAVTGGRKVYELTEAGRAELRHRENELAALESEIAGAVRELARQPREPARPVRWRYAGPRRSGSAGEAAQLDRRLVEFTGEVRDDLRVARLAGADLDRVDQALAAALEEARRTLRRELS